jgi:hypothetical protein
MATFYDIYQNYLKNPYGGINALPGVNAISGTMGATPISSMSGGDGVGEVSSVSPVGNVDNVGNVGGFGNLDTSPKGIVGLIASTVLGGPAGLALNIGGQLAGVPSLSEIGKATMNALGFGGPQAGDLGYTDYSDADIGPVGPQAGDTGVGTFGGYNDFDGTEGTFSTDTSDTGASSGGVDSAGDGGDGYATGGRVGLYDGGSAFDNYRALNLGGRVGYAEGSSNLSREEIINRILQEIKPGFESAREVYPDYYSTGLDVDYLKTLNPDEIKQALDRVYLQGEGFQNADFTSGRIGQGSPFFRYSPEYMKKVNYNNPLQISTSNTAYNLRNQLNELESILGKKNIEAYKTTLDDSLIDYYKNRFTADLDLQKKLFGEQTTPTVAEQMMSPEDALTPLTPDINPLQQHFDQNQMLKDAVARGEITPEQYNVLGGYDVQQTLSPGNPVLGGIGNLIGSTGYNIAQSLIPSKDSSGNVIYEDTPFIIGEDANTIYSQTPRASQLLRDIPGDVMRNVQGGLGLISPELKQTYQDIIQQRAPANITEHINTAISSFNPFQQQQYMNYAVQNPEQAIAAAQQNKDFLEATRKNIAPTVSSPFLNAPKTPIGLFPGGGGGQTTPLIDEGPKTPIGLFPNRGGGEIKPLMADGGRVFYLQGGLASLLG